MRSAGADLALKARTLTAEAEQSQKEGEAVGEIVGFILNALDRNSVTRPSWSQAIDHVSLVSLTRKTSFGPDAAVRYRANKKRVLHLWGAYQLAKHQWFSCGNGPEAVYNFLNDAESILTKLKQWNASDKQQLQNNSGHLDADHYRMPSWALPFKKTGLNPP
jgi:hypothetical protein